MVQFKGGETEEEQGWDCVSQESVVEDADGRDF